MHRWNQAQGGSKPDPPSFFPWRLQWGLSVFQWGSNPPANFYPEWRIQGVEGTIGVSRNLSNSLFYANQ